MTLDTRVVVGSADGPFAESLADALAGVDLSAAVSPTVLTLLEELRGRRVSAAVVDLGLAPGEPAALIRAAREARGSGAFVLVAVSAQPSRPREVIECLKHGAVEYAVKLGDIRVLASRVRALLDALSRRRVERPPALEACDGMIRLDLEGHRCLVGPTHAEVGVSPLEFRFLRELASRPGALVAREDLLKSLWPQDPDRRHLPTMAQLVARLRRKLGRVGSRIRAVRGLGYRLEGGDPRPGGAAMTTCSRSITFASCPNPTRRSPKPS